jgi:hypothetical protein
MEKINSIEEIHNKNAPYWAITLVICGGIGISTMWLDFGPFWKGYVLDITGPAWNYILIRGLFTKYTENAWRKFFTPINTYFIFVIVCFLIETSQFMNLYDSTFDSMDYIAYVSLLTPLFIMDLWQTYGAISTKS